MLKQNQNPKKSFFWFISTLIITTIIIGRIIGYLLAFVLGLILIPLLGEVNIVFPYISIINYIIIYIIILLSYPVGYLIAAKIGLNYCFKESEINKQEIKKFILIFALFPVLTYFILELLIQIYIVGTKSIFAYLSYSWKDLSLALLTWIITSFAVFRWIKGGAVSISVSREKIKKSEIITFIILIILIIGSSWYSVVNFQKEFGSTKLPNLEENQTQLELESEIVNGETYRNEEYGFELRYPKDWVAEEEVYPEAYLLRRNFSKGDYDISLIVVEKFKDDPGFQEYTKGSPDFEIIISSSESDFKGAIYKAILGIPSSTGEIMKVIRGDYIYYLTFIGRGTAETDKSNLAIFHQVLSSFKFLK